MGSHAALKGWLWIKSNKTSFCFVKHYGWPEDGILEAETCSHPEQCI
jgi:hypothetical protein